MRLFLFIAVHEVECLENIYMVMWIVGRNALKRLIMVIVDCRN